MLYQITDTPNCLLITTFIILDFCIIFLFYAIVSFSCIVCATWFVFKDQILPAYCW